MTTTSCFFPALVWDYLCCGDQSVEGTVGDRFDLKVDVVLLAINFHLLLPLGLQGGLELLLSPEDCIER